MLGHLLHRSGLSIKNDGFLYKQLICPVMNYAYIISSLLAAPMSGRYDPSVLTDFGALVTRSPPPTNLLPLAAKVLTTTISRSSAKTGKPLA
jgi:hypothetical protein